MTDQKMMQGYDEINKIEQEIAKRQAKAFEYVLLFFNGNKEHNYRKQHITNTL